MPAPSRRPISCIASSAASFPSRAAATSSRAVAASPRISLASPVGRTPRRELLEMAVALDRCRRTGSPP